MSEGKPKVGVSKAVFAAGLIAAILISTVLSTFITMQYARGPQGEKGDKGDTGATGATGPQGPQGIPGTELVFAHWNVEWRTLTGTGQWGAVIETSTFPGMFYFDWGSGYVFQGYSDYVGFYDAEMQINMQRSGPVTFTVGSDDSIVFWVDGVMKIDDTAYHTYRTRSITINDLSLGFHTLALDYKERTGTAVMSFECDLDLLVWPV